ncbi:MAG TPA: hypothetical protein VFA77_13715, partial [Candidatus Eisenbacteria bacterium]|nr:hypothetical protein [Candidatus Eisenbacteria bacterium]
SYSIFAAVSEGKSTPQAAGLWDTIPKEARSRILANVFCVKCRDSVTITHDREELGACLKTMA